jgi:hypothetical protein
MSPSLRGLFGMGAAPRLPEHVRRQLGGERALAAAAADDGATWLVGTRDRLHAMGDETQTWSWEQVLRADWDEETRQLEVVPVGDFGAPDDRRSYTLNDAADLLTLVRERVSASVVLQRRVQVSGRRGFRVFARRPPRGGPVTWAFELDPGVDPAEPVVRAAMDEALAQAQAALGVTEA